MSTTTVASNDSLPGDDRQLRIVGYGIIVAIFGGLGGWSAIAPIDSAALASGVVTVQTYRKTVQHLEGGIVRRLLVEEGQQVSEGEVLIELEGTQFQAEMEVLRVQQLALQTEEARLLAERDSASAVVYPDSANLANDDPRVVEIRQGQDTLFAARRKAYAGEVSVLEQTVAQLEAQIEGLQSVIRSKRSLLDSYSAEIDDLRGLLEEGLTDRQKLRELERSSVEQQGEVAELIATSAAAEARINESRLRILQVEREFQTGVATQLGDVQARLADINERLAGASDRVERAFIRAPVGGRVLSLDVHTVGGVIAPGQPLMDIVPELESLVVEAHVSPLDIDRVQAGLPARLRFSGFKRSRVPEVLGTVASVSADRIESPTTGAVYYLARVEIDAGQVALLDGVELIPGMPVEAMINTGSRTLLGYLWEPVSESVTRSFRED
jgi:epimerase transport system membrane fusion protein